MQGWHSTERQARRPLFHLALAAGVVLPAAAGLMWLVGGAGGVRYWPAMALAVAWAFAAGCAFFPALRLPQRARASLLAICVAAAVAAPLAIPPSATGLRFLAAVLAVAVVWKLYDLHRSPACGIRMGFAAYVAYLPNWFWFVCRRPPVSPPVARDVRRVLVSAPLLAGAIALAFLLFRANWPWAPFFLEHCIKVAVVFFAAIQIARVSASLWRLAGGVADDATANPMAARTPAGFWRRWNRPYWRFTREHVFEPLGGVRRPALATLAAFAVSGLFHEYVFGVAAGRVQGWQMAFFLLHGCATLATMRVKPRGAAVPLWVAGTLAFNLASAVLFFRSVDAVVPFYWRGR
ncbi:MAG TPA: MBOAT family O-acyltransferase [Tepidisphaeraceae bacterium]|nr:MBOAT family O-acyltransferase [Tepidisphaeraceae bacterium]